MLNHSFNILNSNEKYSHDKCLIPSHAKRPNMGLTFPVPSNKIKWFSCNYHLEITEEHCQISRTYKRHMGLQKKKKNELNLYILAKFEQILNFFSGNHK